MEMSQSKLLYKDIWNFKDIVKLKYYSNFEIKLNWYVLNQLNSLNYVLFQ